MRHIVLFKYEHMAFERIEHLLYRPFRKPHGELEGGRAHHQSKLPRTELPVSLLGSLLYMEVMK